MAPQRPVVGRHAERSAIVAAVDAVAAGEYRLVQVSGEPGIGKTRMLSWLAGYARTRDIPVLIGAALADMPFGPLIDAITGRHDEARDYLRDRLGDERYRRAGTVFPVLATDSRPVSTDGLPVSTDGWPVSTSGRPVSTDNERYRLHGALRSLLAAITPTTGLVLCLDDLHWADAATCEFLAYLVRRPPRVPLLLALSYRPRQQPARLVDAVRGASNTHLALTPLSRAETEELAGLAAGSAEGARLYHASGGNPLYAKLLTGSQPVGDARPCELRGSRDDARTREPRGDGETGPAARPAADGRTNRTGPTSAGGELDAAGQSVGSELAVGSELDAAGRPAGGVRTDVFDRELRGLNDIERTVLATAAVVGDEFDPNLVAAIACRPVGDVLAALDRLAARDLVRGSATEPTLRHRHPLLRQAAYRSTDPDWRLAAHRRAWTILATRGAPAPTVAWHVARSASVGDRGAIAVLLAAAGATEVTAPVSCAGWLDVALSLLPDQPSNIDERSALLTMRARALGMAGHYQTARAVLVNVLALLPDDAHERRASVTAFLAMIERILGRFDSARAMLVAELARHGDQRRPAAAVLLFELALGGLLATSPAEVAPWAGQAVAAARELDDPARLAAALAVFVLHDLDRGRWTAETRDRLREAIALTDSLTDGQLAERLDASVWVGWCELSLDRFADAARHLERGLALSRATGQDHLVGYLRAGLGTAYASLGRLAAAADLLRGDEAITLARRGWIEAWRGDLVEATDIADRIGTLDSDEDKSGNSDKDMSEDSDKGMSGGRDKGMSGAFAALVRHVAGDSAGCVDLLLRAGGGPELSKLDGSSLAFWFQLLAEAEVTAGRPERAPAWAAKAQWAAAAMPLPRKQALAALAWAWGHAATDPTGAAAVAERAARTFGELTDRVS
ncbi:MAG TPA: AAA family ATPase, partial [Pseudonocardiaceae bacterium]